MAKGPDAFRTISEAADEVGVPQHVLRFWESKFTFIRPMKRAGGRRFYRPADLEVLRTIRRLLHEDGYTIKGVQKLYKDSGPARFGIDPSAPEDQTAAPVPEALQDRASRRIEPSPGLAVDADALEDLLGALQAAKGRLDETLGSA